MLHSLPRVPDVTGRYNLKPWPVGLLFLMTFPRTSIE